MTDVSVANTLRRPRPVRKTPAEAAPAIAPESESDSDNRLDTSYLETLLGYNARRAALAVIAVFLRKMAPLELRPVDFSVLTLIAHNPGVTSRQICAELDILPPNLVGMIKSLDQRGLIERKPHPTDRRAQGLHLSPAGKKLQRRAQTLATQLERAVASQLTDDELKQLIDLLRKVYRR